MRSDTIIARVVAGMDASVALHSDFDLTLSLEYTQPRPTTRCSLRRALLPPIERPR
jgi:hypothetical protein